ncbi:MAG: type II secretion system protein, partial [Betaproteobacteria bacterium]|nr:type II secretion system protein [Betaproteobacteria bacterium]
MRAQLFSTPAGMHFADSSGTSRLHRRADMIRRQHGFTLIEIAIVLVIIGL